MKIIYDNQKLNSIIQSIITETVGIQNINDLLIQNTTDEKYTQILIKPCTINISKQICEVLNESQSKPEYVDSEIIEFICYTIVNEFIEEENEEKPVMLNQTLTEMILIDSEIMESTGWKLLYFGSEEI